MCNGLDSNKVSNLLNDKSESNLSRLRFAIVFIAYNSSNLSRVSLATPALLYGLFLRKKEDIGRYWSMISIMSWEYFVHLVMILSKTSLLWVDNRERREE